MIRNIAVLVVGLLIVSAGSARAQDAEPGPSVIEVTIMPVGAAFFTSKGASPSFGSYGFGTAFTYNINSVVGIEGELASMLATTSDLQFGSLDHHIKAPNMLSYTANAVVALKRGHRVVPYATVGFGGLTMYERGDLGITSDKTFVSGNLGGGLKWYAKNNRWGLRGDYRFGATRGKESAPVFFGRDTRYVNRIYGAVIINAVR